MGDEADFLLNQMDWDVAAFYASTPKIPRRPICKYCRKKKLLWRQVKGKWVLFDNRRKPHLCKKYPLPLETLKALAELAKKENDSSSRTKR